MEEVFTLYEKAKDPDFVGQDVTARAILDKSSISHII